MDSDRRFQHVLEACGVNKSLIKRGVKEGDTVVIGEVCLLCPQTDFPKVSLNLSKAPNKNMKIGVGLSNVKIG